MSANNEIITTPEEDEEDDYWDDYWDDYDWCYECTGYGDDYYFDEDGEMICACDNCPHNTWRDDE